MLGEDDVIGEQLALSIQEHHLAPSAKAGIDRQHIFLTERRRQKQFAQVVREDADGLLVRAFLQHRARFAFHRETQQALVAIVRRQLDLRRRRRVVLHKQPFERIERLFLGRREAREQKTFRFPPADRQHSMRGRGRRGFAPVEVILELRALLFLPGDDLRFEHAFRRVDSAQSRAGSVVVVHAFRQNVPRPGERFLRRLYLRMPLLCRVFATDMFPRRRGRIGREVLRK